MIVACILLLINQHNPFLAFNCEIHIYYSSTGILQILFLSGATQYAIQQHCELPRDGYNTLLYPIAEAIDTIHIMWVKTDHKSAVLNHLLRNS